MAQGGTAPTQEALARIEAMLQGEPALAAREAAAILSATPGHPAATLYLGMAQRGTGETDAALRTLRQLAAAHPQWAVAHAELGLLLSEVGLHAEAVTALRRAVALQPQAAAAWRSLGDALAAAGDPAGAQAAHDDQIRATIGAPTGTTSDAEQLLRKHLYAHPMDVEAIHLLAGVAMRRGQFAYAEQLLARCVEFDPARAAARFDLALVLHRLNRPQAALAQLGELMREDPRNLRYRNLKGVLLAAAGDYAGAIDVFTQLLADSPGRPQIWLSLGHALAAAGRMQDCIAAYRRSLAITPALGEAWWSLANLKVFRFDAEDASAMQALLATKDLRVEDRIHLEFALGKALEDASDHAGSFRHFAEGNRLRRGQVNYSADATHAFVERSKRVLAPAFFAARAGSGSGARDPIFVVGLPRSGSTLVEQILASHPAVEGTMELPDIELLARQLAGSGAPGAPTPYPELLAGLDARQCRDLGERYLSDTRAQRHTPRPRFVDKMPNNFLHLGLIRLVLPNATVIDARRHPMACCFSAWKQLFANAQHYTYDLAELGRYYRDYVDYMAHIDRVLPGWVHRVIHEDLVEDTEAQVRRLLDHCGLPFDAACLRFHESGRAVRTASAQQVRQPISRAGLEQWRHFEPWLGPLRDALGPALDGWRGAAQG